MAEKNVNELWLYAWLSRRAPALSYGAKIMLMAFIGTHVPLISLVIYVSLQATGSWHSFLATLVITLLATLAGTGVTLFVLSHLLRPVMMTSRTLRCYRATRDAGTLPTGFDDEVGTLMADTNATLTHLQAVLDRLEHRDESTALPNRRRLVSEVVAMIEGGRSFQLAAIRLTNYRQLAETIDQDTAERAAVAVAARLAEGLAVGDLYRIGDSDFLAIAHEQGDKPVKIGWLKRRFKALLTEAAHAIDMASLSVSPQLCAGITFFPEEGAEAGMLIDQAVAAAARSTGELEVGFHSAEARATALASLALEQELRRAITAGEFELHYQPVVDLALDRTVAVEALIRWRHPQRGLMLPSEFVPTAEASGLIDPIGLWVMRRACAQLREWDEAGLTGLRVAVNLSAGQFRDPELVSHVRGALDDVGLSHGRLEIELTETAAMADLALSRQVFGELRSLGVTIAIDDFGTGYASMRYLHHLPFDKLKIDREFVSHVDSEPGRRAICEAIIALAHGLNLRLVGEGAERAEEVDFLRQRGCELVQGFYFARPMPADALAAHMAQPGAGIAAAPIDTEITGSI